MKTKERERQSWKGSNEWRGGARERERERERVFVCGKRRDSGILDSHFLQKTMNDV